MVYLDFVNFDNQSESFPSNLPAFRSTQKVDFKSSITIFVGENGSGKSTLLKSIALYINLPAIGHSDLDQDQSLESLKLFTKKMHGSWSKRVYRGFFFRAEDYFGFAQRLKQMDQELNHDIADFEKNLSGTGLKLAVGSVAGQKEALKRKYGDLFEVSHGEGFLKILQNRLQPEGIYLIDEPEAALSPQRQLALYSLIKNMSQENNCQFIIATHSPILMTLPDSVIYEFNDGISETEFERTEHFTIMKQFLNNPQQFTRHL